MNKPTEILVITNGSLPVIVPADKWPQNSICLFKCEVKYDNNTPCECERQRVEAIAQGAVVEFDEGNDCDDNWLFLITLATPELINGAYPIDPSKWVVEKHWQYLNISSNKWDNISEKVVEYYKEEGLETRQIATIKPKAESACNCGENHCDTNGCSKRERHLVEDHLQQPAPAPTRKLVSDQLIDYIETLKPSGENELIYAIRKIHAKCKDLKAKEIENLKQAYIEGM